MDKNPEEWFTPGVENQRFHVYSQRQRAWISIRAVDSVFAVVMQ